MAESTLSEQEKEKILNAKPEELTLMLYEGAIKFCGAAIEALDSGDEEQMKYNVKRTGDIITEFRVTLDRSKETWEDFERVYEYIYRRLMDGEREKDKEALSEAKRLIEEMRDTWKEVMKLAAEG